jgi:hypothetical protein
MYRKLYQELLEWKNESQGKSAIMIDGAQRVGKSYLAEEFAKNEYNSYILIDFYVASTEVKELFEKYLDDLDTFFMRISAYYSVKLYERKTIFIFDEVQFGDLTLNSRIVRTGTWETETEEGGFLSPAIYDKYEKIAGSGTGLIISEMFVLDRKDRFAPYSANLNYIGFVKEYKMIADICHNHDVPILGQLAFFYYDDGDNQKAEPNDLTAEGIRKLQAEVIMAAKKFSFAGFDGIQIDMGNNFY